MLRMTRDRQSIAAGAAAALQSAAAPPALVGFDGFIDTIIDAVDVRTDMSPNGYRRIPTISAFAARCAAAAGRSANIERVVRERRFGGNGPLMAGALARLGSSVTFIGAVGDGAGGLDPVFAPFADRCRRVIATGPPSHTDCLEFDDGKLMFNETAAVQGVTWEHIVEVAGLEELIRIVDGARVIGIVNWSLLAGVPGIWRGLMRDVLPRVSSAPRRVMIDLSDPSKRTDADVREAMDLLRALNASGPAVTLGLNLNEAGRIGLLAGLSGALGLESSGEDLRQRAGAIRERLGLDSVVVHRHTGAAAADGASAAWFAGPYTKTPRLSTGAGDHFNGAFAFARAVGMPIAECLAVGCAASGAYVRDSQSPTRERVVAFLSDLPRPEEAGV
jgi:sugar/nucleoside kinase (ribokinase family)